MKKPNRKNPWRFLFAAIAVLGAIPLLGGLAVNVLYLVLAARELASQADSASIGIIGGADGPTAIFVAAPALASYIPPLCAFAVGIAGFIALSRPRQ